VDLKLSIANILNKNYLILIDLKVQEKLIEDKFLLNLDLDIRI
jgi:hypothetical protein